MTVTPSMAQTSYEDALTAIVGENKYNVEGEKADSVFWKFTADKNYLAKIAPLDGKYDNIYVNLIKKNDTGEKNDTLTINGAQDNYPTKTYPLEKGQTYYFLIYNNGEIGMNLSLEENDNLGGGLSAEEPAPLANGKTTFVGDAMRQNGYDSYKAYAQYIAEEDGQLVLSSYSYISFDVNGTTVYGEYKDGKYETKMGVEKGKTYLLTFSISQPIALTAQVTHPEKGSVDMPFDMVEGENVLPAKAGDYYYTYTPTKTGFLTISSKNALPGGCVKIYSSKYSLQYNTPTASSERSSFDVRLEVPNTYGSTYYIVVEKVDDTEADETFNMTMEEYKAGDVESNPIAIGELPATETLPTAKGTYYYKVDVPANTNKFLLVKTGLKNANENTKVYVYPNAYGSSPYSGVNGTDNIQYDVTSSSDASYLIKVVSEESEPFSFSVSYKNIEKGDLINNPADAVVGDNTISSDGTKYYAYTATRDGKLVVTGTPEMTVSFPCGTGMYDGNYEDFTSGVTHYIEATANTKYLIKIEGAAKGDVFSLAEEDFKQGESRNNPIVVTGDSYKLPANAANLWLKYNVEKDGVITVDCDAPYDYNSTVEMGKESEDYLTGIMYTENDGSSSTTYYRGSRSVSAGDVLVLHLKMKSNMSNYSITFSQRDYVAGESLSTPIVLEENKTVTIPTAGRTNPIWVKASLVNGEAKFKSNGYLSGNIYSSAEDAKNDVGGEYVAFTYDYTSSNNEYVYNKTVSKTGEYYFMFTQSYGETDITMISNGSTTAIGNINANSGAYMMNGNTLSANGENVSVYSINGSRIANVANGNSINLKAGVYVVYSNGKAKKIVVE